MSEGGGWEKPATGKNKQAIIINLVAILQQFCGPAIQVFSCKTYTWSGLALSNPSYYHVDVKVLVDGSFLIGLGSR